MIDYTTNTVDSVSRMWTWKSDAGGAAPDPGTPAAFEFAEWFGSVVGFYGWSWVSAAGGSAPDPGAADDYIVRARRRGRR